MSETKQLKVLVSSFVFSPVKGSEFAMGWDYVRAIAAHHKVWLITRSNERVETEQYLREHHGTLQSVQIHYVPFSESEFAYPLHEIPYYFMFRNWHWRVYQLARKLDREMDFDIVHQAIPSGFREPGFLWKINKPFVWGPVGGLQYFPIKYLNVVPLRAQLFLIAKNLSTVWAMHISRRPKLAAARAAAIVAGTGMASKKIEELWGRTSHVLCEVSAPVFSGQRPARRQPGEIFHIVWCGRFEPRKALNIVLLALARFRQSSTTWQLTCIGDGELFDTWKKLAETCGISDQCRFLGRIPREDAIATLASGHCFVQPSLYDATTSVVLEALAMGLPVVCLDHCGFREVVDESCGIRIKPRRLEQIVEDFTSAFQTLELDEESRFQMAIAAKKAALNYTWMRKADVLANVYDSIVDTGSSRTLKPA